MKKNWFPQQNNLDSPAAILKNFVYTLGHAISRSTIEKDTRAHAEFPWLSFGALAQLLDKWGLQTITYRIEISNLEKIPFPSITFIHDKGRQLEMGIFIMIGSLSGSTIEYLHPRKGWVSESLESFNEKWENAVLSVTGCNLPAGEPDFEERERRYVLEKKANPDLKLLRTMDDFLSPDECDYIIRLSDKKFKPSRVMTEDENKTEGRTSYSAELVFPEDAILNNIKKRASKLIGMPETHFEFFQCVSYGPGQEFQNHYDTFDEKTAAGKKAIDEEGQRKYTMLVYLNDDFEGGFTHFPLLDTLIQPKKGRVIIFDNLDENGEVKKAAFHAGLPVKTGKKYAVNMWVRTKATIPSNYL